MVLQVMPQQYTDAEKLTELLISLFGRGKFRVDVSVAEDSFSLVAILV